MVRCPEQTTSRHHRKYPGDQENGGGSLEYVGGHPGDDGHEHGSCHCGKGDSERGVTEEHQIGQPAESPAYSRLKPELPAHSEQHREADRAHKCREGLEGESRCETVRSRREDDFHHRALQPAVDSEGDYHAHGDAEEHHQGVQQPGGSCKIVLVCQILDTVGEWHSGDQRNQRTDDHIPQVHTEPEAMENDAERCRKGAACNVADYLGGVRRSDEADESPEQGTCHEGRRSIHQPASEYDAEPGRAHCRSEYLSPIAGRLHIPNGCESFPRLVDGQKPVRDVP